jgi:alkylation response protein AidB-like acyl-CoA dehydrogenase
MDFGDTPGEAAFRAEVRAFLEANAPRREASGPRRSVMAGARTVDEQDEQERAELAAATAWQHELADAGWAGISWPTAYGGRGGTVLEEAIFAEEAIAFDVPDSNLFRISIGMVGPTLIAHGRPDQKERHLRPILRGDEIWCQLFSEPGAGSDLAGLRTRAVRGDGGWTVSGQKVWTTGARLARYGALLARTNGSVPKHRGITYLVLDMSAPGIEIRPIRQINGDAHFNEVFLTDVWVPDDAVVGDVDDGWRVANTMLLSERGQFASAGITDFEDLVELARLRGRADDPALRHELAKVYGREQTIRLLGLVSRTALSRGTSAPFVASITKLLMAQRSRQLTRLALELIGAEAVVDGADGFGGGGWQYRYLTAPVGRIAGGTDEIQKNILGERFLGLPKDVRSDTTVPFDELPKA